MVCPCVNVQILVVRLIFALSSVTLAGNVLRLGEGGDLTTNVHTKHTLQIYEKLSYEALNRHFCQTAVSGWASLFSVCQQHFLSC